MARTYAQDLAAISAVFPGLGPKERDALLWRAILDICNENDLSFMIGEARIVTEAPYKTGTISATTNNKAISLTGGAWDPTWTHRKVKIKGRDEAYEIETFGSTTTATLNDEWLGATATDLTYVMYRDVYQLPTDCEMSKEVLLYEPSLRTRIEIVDHAAFRQCKRELGVILGLPTEIARLGIDDTGRALVEFGPRVPDSQRVYQLDHFRSPQKPATIDSPMSPAWPTAFEDVRVLRALAEYADQKGHQRRFEFRDKYDKRVWQMKAKFDGGNEMRRRIEGTSNRRSRGMTIYARLG